MSEQTIRPLALIAREIREAWPKVNYAAEPYLRAMSALGSVDDTYGADQGRSIVRYFLSNAAGFRGDEARRIKAELKAALNTKGR